MNLEIVNYNAITSYELINDNYKITYENNETEFIPKWIFEETWFYALTELKKQMTMFEMIFKNSIKKLLRHP